MALWSNPLALDAAQSAIESLITRMIRSFSRRHPRSVAAIVVLSFAAFLLLPFLFLTPEDLTNGTGAFTFEGMTGGIVAQALLTICLIGIIAVLGWYDVTRIRGPIDRKGVKSFFWLAALPMLASLLMGISLFSIEQDFSPIIVLITVLVLNLLVGLSEELLFRGILFGALRQRHSLITAIFLSSFIFGLAHMPNLGLGQSLPLTLYQVINAMILGALFCAITLQTNSIWPAVFLHMMWNSGIMLTQFVSETLTPQTATQIADYPVISFGSMIPLLIVFWIAAVILRLYTTRTGQSLRAVVPTYTVNDHISA